VSSETYTLLDAGAAATVDVAARGGRACLSPEALESATGWSVKPEGFCLGDVCVPARGALEDDGMVDVSAFGRLTGRPVIVDEAEQIISLGAAAAIRGEALQTLEAPDFTLPDLDGQLHSLSDYRGQKILLAAYASW